MIPTVPSFPLQDSTKCQYPHNATQCQADRPRGELAQPSGQKNPRQGSRQNPEVQKITRVIFGEAEWNTTSNSPGPRVLPGMSSILISEDPSNGVECQVVDRFVGGPQWSVAFLTRFAIRTKTLICSFKWEWAGWSIGLSGCPKRAQLRA